MIARARLISIVLVVLCGALGLMSSTQVWLHVRLTGAASHDLTVTGAAAVPILAPLSLAVLALGVALSIVGLVLRYVFGALALAIGGALTALCAQVAFTHPLAAVERTVTDATGIAGGSAVADMIAAITSTAWPITMIAVSLVLCAAGVFVLVTARRWSASGRKYRTAVSSRPATGALDAVDSWDDLSRGEDPTGDDDPR